MALGESLGVRTDRLAKVIDEAANIAYWSPWEHGTVAHNSLTGAPEPVFRLGENNRKLLERCAATKDSYERAKGTKFPRSTGKADRKAARHQGDVPGRGLTSLERSQLARRLGWTSSERAI